MLRRTFNLSFTTAVAILLASAIGLHTIVQAMEMFLVKRAVPLQRDLANIPRAFGPYIMVSKDEPLPAAIAEELGTRDYLTRIYQDTEVGPRDPRAYVRWHVAYYTGTPDGVPHIPERCFVSRGAEPVRVLIESLELQGEHIQPNEAGRIKATTAAGDVVRLPDDRMELSVFQYLPLESDTPDSVRYFFVVNGKIKPRPRDVRASAFDLRSKYAYFCKVEVMPVARVEDPQDARRMIERFLAYALPELFRCLPDWDAVLEGRLPDGNR